jgi:hypothetical protein
VSENTYEPDFDFEEGDTVLVRVRENGSIVAKFEATCTDISDPSGIGTSRKARFEMPFGVMNSVTIRPYEAEFEVVNDD